MPKRVEEFKQIKGDYEKLLSDNNTAQAALDAKKTDYEKQATKFATAVAEAYDNIVNDFKVAITDYDGRLGELNTTKIYHYAIKRLNYAKEDCENKLAALVNAKEANKPYDDENLAFIKAQEFYKAAEES